MEEKKQYRSALRSRRLIRQAFLGLLAEKKFEKITVTDIVNRADINRSTFYAHYPDVLGLVEELVDEVIEGSAELIADMDPQDIFRDPRPMLEGLTRIGTRNIEFYRLLGNSDFALRQVEKIKILLTEKALSNMDIPEDVRSSAAFRIQVTFFIGGILNTYQQWLQGNLDCSIDQIADQMAALIVRTGDMAVSSGAGPAAN